MRKKKIGDPRLGVAWHVPKRKTPIGYTTQATSDLISLFSEEGLTFQEAYNAINYDTEAKVLLQEYINLGYGEHNMAKFGVK